MRRCGSGRAAWLAQNLRGAEGRCDSARVFCEAGVDRAFTASQRISSGWWGRVGVEGKVRGCDGKGALPGREDCGCENDVRAVSLGLKQLGEAPRKEGHLSGQAPAWPVPPGALRARHARRARLVSSLIK